jgi:hypothetical protein
MMVYHSIFDFCLAVCSLLTKGISLTRISLKDHIAFEIFGTVLLLMYEKLFEFGYEHPFNSLNVGIAFHTGNKVAIFRVLWHPNACHETCDSGFLQIRARDAHAVSRYNEYINLCQKLKYNRLPIFLDDNLNNMRFVMYANSSLRVFAAIPA